MSLFLPVLTFVFFSIASGGSFGWQSVGVSIQQAMIPAIIGWGIMFNMTVGNFDLSPGSMIYMIALMAGAVENRLGMVGMVATCLLLGAVCGLINATVYTIARIPSFIVTVAMMLVYETIAKLFANGRGYQIAPKHCFLGHAPWVFAVALIVALASYLLLNRTKFGKNVTALGSNDILARTIGVNVTKTKFFTFFVVGCFVGIAALVQLSYGGSAWPPAGVMASSGVAFKSIMAFQIAFYIRKYCPLTIGMLIGSVVMAMLNTGMVSINVPGNFQQTVIGVVLIAIVVFSENNGKIQAFFQERRKRCTA